MSYDPMWDRFTAHYTRLDCLRAAERFVSDRKLAGQVRFPGHRKAGNVMWVQVPHVSEQLSYGTVVRFDLVRGKTRTVLTVDTDDLTVTVSAKT